MNRILSWLGGLMLLAANAAGAPHPTLFPAQEGNYWILQSSLGGQKIIVCEPGTNKLVQVTGLSARNVAFYASPSSTRLYRLDPTKGRLRRTVNLRPAKTGHSTFSTGNRPCDQLLVALDPVAGSIATQTGAYSGCSVLRINAIDPILPGACAGLAERIYFAPGVGPVEIEGTVGGNYLLVEAQVGDNFIGGQ